MPHRSRAMLNATDPCHDLHWAGGYLCFCQLPGVGEAPRLKELPLADNEIGDLRSDTNQQCVLYDIKFVAEYLLRKLLLFSVSSVGLAIVERQRNHTILLVYLTVEIRMGRNQLES